MHDNYLMNKVCILKGFTRNEVALIFPYQCALVCIYMAVVVLYRVHMTVTF